MPESPAIWAQFDAVPGDVSPGATVAVTVQDFTCGHQFDGGGDRPSRSAWGGGITDRPALPRPPAAVAANRWLIRWHERSLEGIAHDRGIFTSTRGMVVLAVLTEGISDTYVADDLIGRIRLAVVQDRGLAP